jgi:prepilin-type N-terminal cleavage/methylation domain-containing protein
MKAMVAGPANALEQQHARLRGGSPETNRAGFTLIELLVVIGIIALLMAVLLPSFQRVRKQAKAAVCLSHLKQWGMTFALFFEDKDGRLPRWGQRTEDDCDPRFSLLRGMYLGGRPDANVPGRYNPVRTDKIACCPMATKTGGRGTFRASRSGQLYVEGTLGSTFTAWEMTTPPPPFRMSYGLNEDLFTWLFDGLPIRGRPSPYTYVFTSRDLDNTPLLLDSARPSGSLSSEKQPPPPQDSLDFAWPVCINRHHGTINVLFLDSSVRRVGLKGLWTLKWRRDFNTSGPWTKAGGVKPEDWPPWMRKFKDY